MIYLNAIQEYLDKYASRGYFPGAAYAIFCNDNTHLLTAGVLDPAQIESTVKPDSIFDIASVTKPVATATAILQLFEQGRLDLDEPASRYIEEFKSSPDKCQITIKQLITHSSGLPAWLPLYIHCRQPDDVFHFLARTELIASPGYQVEYSCMGYIILAEIIRRVTGNSLAKFCQRHIFEPLKLNDTCFNPNDELRSRIAPTEMGNEYERFLAGNIRQRYTGWRRHRLHGEVQDGNASFIHGEGGNAGLFSSAVDLMRYCRCILNYGSFDGVQILKPETVHLACQVHTPGLDTQRGLGWLMAVSSRSAGAKFSSKAIGHNGFSGTSAWIDLEKELIVILLTNRSYFGGDGNSFGKLRSPFNELVVQECCAKSS